jgi:NTE family protein
MASACLPTVFQAVEIDGEPYWDGGYMGNPALYPLFYDIGTDDILLVQINPIERRETPRETAEIHNRLNEITFNGGLLRELRSIEFVTRLIDEGKLSRAEYKRVLMHRINGGRKIDAFTASTRLNADYDFFVELRDLGRGTAQAWLAEHYDAIGERATLDLKAAYS